MKWMQTYGSCVNSTLKRVSNFKFQISILKDLAKRKEIFKTMVIKE